MTCAADTAAERYARELPELGAWLWREFGGRRVRDIGDVAAACVLDFARQAAACPGLVWGQGPGASLATFDVVVGRQLVVTW